MIWTFLRIYVFFFDGFMEDNPDIFIFRWICVDYVPMVLWMTSMDDLEGWFSNLWMVFLRNLKKLF